MAKSPPKTTNPVRPNSGVTAWYRVQLQDALRAMKRDLVVHIRAAHEEAAPTFGMAHDAGANQTRLLKLALQKWGGLWTKRLDVLSLKLSALFADKAQRATDTSMREAFRVAGFTVKFKPTSGSVSAFQAVIAENVNLIRSIPQQFLKDVETAVWTSVMAGGSLTELSNKIESSYGVGYRRAALIARDQNAKAKAVMERTRRRELGVTEAIWQHSAGGKEPRPTHVAMSGKRYRIDDGMYDSAIGKNTWPGIEINCRCTSRAVLPGFED